MIPISFINCTFNNPLSVNNGLPSGVLMFFNCFASHRPKTSTLASSPSYVNISSQNSILPLVPLRKENSHVDFIPISAPFSNGNRTCSNSSGSSCSVLKSLMSHDNSTVWLCNCSVKINLYYLFQAYIRTYVQGGWNPWWENLGRWDGREEGLIDERYGFSEFLGGAWCWI